MEDLKGRTYIVTGAASGLGLAAARHLVALGANVVLGDLDETALEDAAQGLGAKAAVAKIDVRRPGDCERLTSAALERFGALHGAVCSAGVDSLTPVLEMSLAAWQRVIDINLTGTFLTAQAAARTMLASGSKGSIVTFASGIAVRGRAAGAHYASTKAGIIAFSKSLALELASRGIRVNAVAPGLVDTPLARSVMNEADRRARAAQVPLGRMGEPQDIAGVIAFLLSDASGWITGQALHANGGTLMP